MNTSKYRETIPIKMEVIRPTPKQAELRKSPDPDKYACVRCRYGLLGKSESKEFVLCRRLNKWTIWDFYCNYYTHRSSKKHQKKVCVIYVEGKRHTHPSKKCDTCLMNPETCTTSPHYNSNWDPVRGRWRTQVEGRN